MRKVSSTNYRDWTEKGMHDLSDARDCARFEKGFAAFLDDCLLLSRYYIETRYPPLVPIEYTKAEAKKAIEIAEGIVGFIEKRLH